MKVRVTSIVWEEVGELVRSVGAAMERALTAPFQDLSFGGGIDQLFIIIVSMSSDVDENAKVCKGYNKVSRARHPVNGELIRSIGFAVPIDPDTLVTMTSRDLVGMICTTVAEKLTRRYPRLPKDFGYGQFTLHLGKAIMDYRLASSC